MHGSYTCGIRGFISIVLLPYKLHAVGACVN